MVSEFESNGVNFQIVNEEFAFFQYGIGGSTFQSFADAARDLDSQLQGQTDVKLIGFSKGDAVVMEYLAQMVEGTIGMNAQVNRAITINSPLDGDALLSGLAKFDRKSTVPLGGRSTTDRLANLSSDLAQKNSAMNVSITTVVDPNNFTRHMEILGPTSSPCLPATGFWATWYLPGSTRCTAMSSVTRPSGRRK